MFRCSNSCFTIGIFHYKRLCSPFLERNGSHISTTVERSVAERRCLFGNLYITCFRVRNPYNYGFIRIIKYTVIRRIFSAFFDNIDVLYINLFGRAIRITSLNYVITAKYNICQSATKPCTVSVFKYVVITRIYTACSLRQVKGGKCRTVNKCALGKR